MSEIVRNVAANEKLYDNLEFKFELNYQRATAVPVEHGTVLTCTTRMHFAYQGGLIFFERDAFYQMRDSEKHSRAALAYDGEVTRSLEGNAANLRRYRFEGNSLLRPHTIVFRAPLDMRGRRLSRLLSTGEFGAFLVPKVEFEAEETINGLSCQRVWLELSRPGWNVPDFGYLWLCPDRNYIAVKYVGYATNYSSEIPLHTAYVSDFRELSPGIWFPFSYSETTNFGLAAAEGKAVLLHSSQARVTEARLDPDHPRSFFQLHIPDGTAVYEVADEQIVDSRIQGAPLGQRRTWLWWLVGLLAVAGVLAAYLRYWRRGAASFALR